ncbi:MAG: tetratricopeptide repeat protein [Chitinivibrionales bacterium]|nr:tetratricopeptide repeat protein [Chitinivibrionales bacterium]MBD3357910.1 tetratricopeptide repeat protein [Chitinivibrionales bacterium]
MMNEWLDLPDLIEHAQEYIDIGLYADARSLLDKYAEVYTDSWEVHFLYSRIHSEHNENEKAIECLQHSLRLERNNPDSLVAMFYAYTQAGHTKRGSRYLLRAERLHPDNDLVLNALIWYHTENNDYQRAIACYERGRVLLEDNPESLRNVGVAYERLGKFEEACHCYELALEINPYFDEARDLLADYHMLHGDAAKAVELYESFLRQSPSNVKALSRLVFCLSQDDRTAEAEKMAEHMIKQYPNSPVGYVDLAYVHLNNGTPSKALTAADRALDVSPIDAEAMRVRAIALAEEKNNEDARKAFEAAMSLDNQNPEIMRDYYHFLRETDKNEEMKKVVDQVIEQEKPYCVEDYWFLADYCREQGENLQAFDYLRKAYRSMPGEKELIPPMVDILLDSNHTRLALPFLKRYVETKGWNTVMNKFARHKRFRGKWSQEGLRFLRFYGQHNSDFREFIFNRYFKYSLLVSLAVTLPLLVLLSATLLGKAGVPIALGVAALLVATTKGIALIIRRTRIRYKKAAEG